MTSKERKATADALKLTKALISAKKLAQEIKKNTSADFGEILLACRVIKALKSQNLL